MLPWLEVCFVRGFAEFKMGRGIFLPLFDDVDRAYFLFFTIFVILYSLDEMFHTIKFLIFNFQ